MPAQSLLHNANQSQALVGSPCAHYVKAKVTWNVKIDETSPCSPSFECNCGKTVITKNISWPIRLPLVENDSQPTISNGWTCKCMVALQIIPKDYSQHNLYELLKAMTIIPNHYERQQIGLSKRQSDRRDFEGDNNTEYISLKSDGA